MHLIWSQRVYYFSTIAIRAIQIVYSPTEIEIAHFSCDHNLYNSYMYQKGVESH